MIPFTSVRAAIACANWHFDGACSVLIKDNQPAVLVRIDKNTFNDQFIELARWKCEP